MNATYAQGDRIRVTAGRHAGLVTEVTRTEPSHADPDRQLIWVEINGQAGWYHAREIEAATEGTERARMRKALGHLADARYPQVEDATEVRLFCLLVDVADAYVAELERLGAPDATRMAMEGLTENLGDIRGWHCHGPVEPVSETIAKLRTELTGPEAEPAWDGQACPGCGSHDRPARLATFGGTCRDGWHATHPAPAQPEL